MLKEIKIETQSPLFCHSERTFCLESKSQRSSIIANYLIVINNFYPTHFCLHLFVLIRFFQKDKNEGFSWYSLLTNFLKPLPHKLFTWWWIMVWLPNILEKPFTSSPVQALFISPYEPNLAAIKSCGDAMPTTWKR